MSSPKEFLPLLYQAMATPFGIEFPTSDVTRLRARLYAARSASKDPSLSCLQFRDTPNNDAVWIVKGQSKDE
jgi:hypothetical protein